MGGQRREFSSEYKDEAVKLVINTGRTVAVVARELGLLRLGLDSAYDGCAVRRMRSNGRLHCRAQLRLAVPQRWRTAARPPWAERCWDVSLKFVATAGGSRGTRSGQDGRAGRDRLCGAVLGCRNQRVRTTSWA